MVSAQPQFLTMLLNGLLVAFVVTFPLLLALLGLSILRRSLNADRRAFEKDVLEKLARIQRDVSAFQRTADPGKKTSEP
jgi:hypothetical protein